MLTVLLMCWAISFSMVNFCMASCAAQETTVSTNSHSQHSDHLTYQRQLPQSACPQSVTRSVWYTGGLLDATHHVGRLDLGYNYLSAIPSARPQGPGKDETHLRACRGWRAGERSRRPWLRLRSDRGSKSGV